MFKKILNDNKLKATPKRLAILELLNSNNRYFSASEIYDEMKENFNKLGISTIYRILHELVSIKLVAIYFHQESNEMKYFICLNNSPHHHHFICTKCNKIQCLHYCNSKELKSETKKQLNAEMQNHIMQIEGLCSECRGEK